MAYAILLRRGMHPPAPLFFFLERAGGIVVIFTEYSGQAVINHIPFEVLHAPVKVPSTSVQTFHPRFQ